MMTIYECRDIACLTCVYIYLDVYIVIVTLIVMLDWILLQTWLLPVFLSIYNVNIAKDICQGSEVGKCGW
jgi:hypothetical protein